MCSVESKSLNTLLIHPANSKSHPDERVHRNQRGSEDRRSLRRAIPIYRENEQYGPRAIQICWISAILIQLHDMSCPAKLPKESETARRQYANRNRKR